MATVIIYADGDLERLNALVRDRVLAEVKLAEAKAEQATALRYGDGEDVVLAEAVEAARQAYDDFEAEAADRAEAWELQPIGHTEFRELVAAHPARRIPNPEAGAPGEPATIVHPDDAEYAVDVTAFGRALLLFVDPEDPEIRTVTQPADGLVRRLKRLRAGHFDRLWRTAYDLNTEDVLDPKWLRSSTARTSSEI
ncbi:hypothetical protein [Nocardioides montaniterrae]